MDAIRPAPLPPKPPKPKGRKRWILWTAGALCVLLGIGAGVWFGGPGHNSPQGNVQTSQTPGPAPYQYVMTVTATSPKPGEILLVFPNAKDLDGFESYIIYRDNIPIDQFAEWNDKGYVYLTGDQKAEFCFVVVALLLTEKPPAGPENKPACLSANGKPRG